MGEWILHVDLDQFLAAVEVLRRPELAGRPVVVGGDGDPRRPRQVVATASYEARAFGVRSGMPLGQAMRRCPEAVFLPTDRPAYDAASARVMQKCGMTYEGTYYTKDFEGNGAVEHHYSITAPAKEVP